MTCAICLAATVIGMTTLMEVAYLYGLHKGKENGKYEAKLKVYVSMWRQIGYRKYRATDLELAHSMSNERFRDYTRGMKAALKELL